MPISSPPQDYDLHPSGTSGTLVGPSVLIVSDDMQSILSPGQTGHIMIKGSPCFQGYETSSTALDRESFFTIDGDPDWFCTGDCGYLDQEGYLFISGRSKEIINRGGETISPFEIEEAILSHPSVQEVMCFSSPHNHFQETVGAVLVLKRDCLRPDLPHLHKHLETSLHRSKWPQVFLPPHLNARHLTSASLSLRSSSS
jgi:acyl-coenzyme A synthetase/AMP-(fatty) acid ligase